MTRQLQVLIEAFAAGFFALSTLMTPVWAARMFYTTTPLDAASLLLMESRLDMAPQVLDVVSYPDNAVMWALLIAAVIAALLHLGWRLADRMSPPAPWALIWGLTAGGLYHLGALIDPLLALALGLAAAGLMIVGVIDPPARRRAAAVPAPDPDPADAEVRHGRGAQLWAAAFVAGWTLMIACAALVEVAHDTLGIGPERAMLLGLLVAAHVATRAQLQIGAVISFALAVIWAMIGIAASTVSASITIATACVLGIAALAVVVVRVTT